MYLNAVHAESHIPTLRSLIHGNPLGIFTTAIDSPNYPLIQSSHIPWLLDVKDPASETELGVLRGHMARANPHAQALVEALSHRQGSDGDGKDNVLQQDVMVLFTLPANHYVSPKFYTATKPATGKVVPTWNYTAVQVYGKARVYYARDDPLTDAFLSTQVRDLSNIGETGIMGFKEPWVVDDAPERYIGVLKKAILGVEITLESMGGKWKMSQELPADRKGVAEGFEGLGTDTGRDIARMVRERGELADAKRSKN